MPTILQRAKAVIEGDRGHGTNTTGHPLYMPPKDIPQAQALGGRSQGKRSTPPDTQPSDFNKTPPPHLKVLPWVQDVQIEGYQPPEGIFGPYDSQPPTRPQTIHDVAPPPQGRAVHPYAYDPGQTLPFAALSSDQQGTAAAQKGIGGRQPTRESEVMSRGAGLGRPPTLGPVIGQETNYDQTGSVGMGTFGKDSGKHHPNERSGSPIKGIHGMQYPHGNPPNHSLPPSPIAKSVTSQTKRVPVPAEDPSPQDQGSKQPHIHPPHHDYPFSHTEAAQKQAEAMAEARAQALAQLQASNDQANGAPAQSKSPGPKGPRRTYETSTSGPSFGHILHQDGRPMRLSGPPLPPGHPQSVPIARDTGGNQPFMRIPFGVPMGASIQRPLFVMRNSVGVGMGVGLGGQGLQGSGLAFGGPPHGHGISAADRAKDARSAYVETIEDEQAPTAPTATNQTPTRRAPSATVPSPSQNGARHAAGESPLSSQTVGGPGYAQQASGHDETHGDRIASGLSDRTVRAQSRLSHSHHPPRHQSRPSGDARSIAPSQAASIAPTTVSNVKKIVADSRFHDETLCQLLDAARLNLIGGEAKKALNRAARARVMELKDIKAQSCAGDVPDSSTLKRHKKKSSKDKHTRKSESRRSDHGDPPPSNNQNGNIDHTQAPAPPPWVNDIMSRLEAFDARFSELEKQKHNQPFFEHFADEAPPHQDFVGDLLDDLIHNELGPEFGQMLGFQRGPHQVLPAIGSNITSHAPNQFSTVDAQYGYRAPNNDQGVHFMTSIQTYESGDPSQGTRLAASQGQGTVHRAASGNGDLIWGSEVELPAPGDQISPPRPNGPTINVQPPTESNIGKSSYRMASGPTYSAATPRTPPGMPRGRDLVFEAPGGVIQGQERDLPAAPSESILSQRQSPVPKAPDSMPAMTHSHGGTPGARASKLPSAYGNIPRSTAFDTAPEVQPRSILQPERTYATPPRQAQHGTPGRDRIHITDSMQTNDKADAWDLVTQQLYSWALVWPEEVLTNALHDISLGKQVGEVPLTTFMMMTYKRLLRHNLTSIPARSCDKLFVPPTICADINAAVHNKQFDNASKFLTDLWDSHQSSGEPPRVIIALAKHRNENDLWTAHRFDLTSHHLTSYGISHDEMNLKDGRPFMWWYAIRLAWPQCKIPDPYDAGLQVRFEHIKTAPDSRSDNSLVAANMARNLLLGYRPERPTDYAKMRELVWGEMKRLLHKKQSGRLVVDPDSTDHVFDV